MKKPPAFTIVHRPRREPLSEGAAAGPLGPGLRRAARSATSATRRVGAGSAAAPALRVGIWDIDAYVGRLPAVVATLNQAQGAFCFFEVMAPVPAGLISRPERVRAWILRRFGRRRVPGLERNVIAADFFGRAETIRRAQGLDYLAGLTASMIADDGDDDADWNLFSTSRRRLLLVSTHELRRYATQARRPFEAAVGAVIVGQLLVARHAPLGFHDDTGCLFDYNDKRSDIVRMLRQPKIDAACLKLIPARDRSVAQALIRAMADYSEESPR